MCSWLAGILIASGVVLSLLNLMLTAGSEAERPTSSAGEALSSHNV